MEISASLESQPHIFVVPVLTGCVNPVWILGFASMLMEISSEMIHRVELDNRRAACRERLFTLHGRLTIFSIPDFRLTMLPNWLRVFLKVELSAKPHERWV